MNEVRRVASIAAAMLTAAALGGGLAVATGSQPDPTTTTPELLALIESTTAPPTTAAPTLPPSTETDSTTAPSTIAPTTVAPAPAPTKATTTTTRPPAPTTTARPSPPVQARVGGIWRPPPGTTWQWQLTGSVDTSVDAQMFDIDLDVSASVVSTLHSQGKVVVCYISAGSWENWRSDAGDFPDSVLGNSNGWPGEKWLDVRQIGVLRPIMEARMNRCVQKGFDGIEVDNIDGYSNRTGFDISAADQLAYNKMLADIAHARKLSIGFKNNVEQAAQSVGWYDWAIDEECAQYNECGPLSVFIKSGKAVFHVEYSLDTSEFCAETTALGFSSMRKKLDLDAWRQTC